MDAALQADIIAFTINNYNHYKANATAEQKAKVTELRAQLTNEESKAAKFAEY